MSVGLCVCVGLGCLDVWQSDGDGDRCDKCADVPVISDTPGSLRVGVLGGGGEAGEKRWAVFDKYGRDSICKQGRTLDF